MIDEDGDDRDLPNDEIWRRNWARVFWLNVFFVGLVGGVWYYNHGEKFWALISGN